MSQNVVPKNFGKFTGKQLCQGLFFRPQSSLSYNCHQGPKASTSRNTPLKMKESVGSQKHIVVTKIFLMTEYLKIAS